MELKKLQKVMRVLKETDLRELEYEKDDVKLYMKKSYVPSVKKVINNPSIVEAKKEVFEVKSYNVGKFFYITKDGKALLSIGKYVKEGDKLGYVESVGIKTDIYSSVEGKIIEIAVENGNLADYGRVLVRIEKE